MHPSPEDLPEKSTGSASLPPRSRFHLRKPSCFCDGSGHPPTGSDDRIVSLAILAKPEYMLIIEAAVLLLAAQAFTIKRLAGLALSNLADRSIFAVTIFGQHRPADLIMAY